MTVADIVYPSGPLTPHGWWHLVNDTRPTMRLRAHDGSIDFYLLGGHAPPFHDPTHPEAVAIKSLKGLVPPSKDITQKGATEDGVTFIDSLYDPTEVEMVVECMGRDTKHLKRVVRDLIASLDAKEPSELAFFTQDLGWWWAPVRWSKGAPGDPLANQARVRQQLSLRLQADDAFWRAGDDVSMFAPSYEAMTDTFTTDYATDLGPSVPQRYTGSGGGYCYADDGQARWKDDPDDQFTTQAREVVNGPYPTFTDTDNQVINMVIGSIPEFTIGDGAYNDLWGRMNRSAGAWAGSGIRARIGMHHVLPWIKLSYFDGFTEHIMTERPLLVMPLFGEKFTLLCGNESDPHLFQVLRNGMPILQHRSEAPNIGASYRGYGFGMRAGAALITQATPANVRKISAGDNTTVTQTGFLQCLNVGDQPMYRDHTVFGPGLFRIYDGPGSSDFVEFGPLLPNQVAFLRTDPRTHTTLVQDLTTVAPTPQELNIFQAAINQLLTFAGADTNAFLQQFQSAFGIRTAQGPMYSLLKGRFSDNSAIRAKSPGRPAHPYFVRVDIDDGDANSKIISAGTPLRRYPL
ncbi:MAG TPA: hypothetical protein PLF91_00140 [Mycolicibacterium fallax]|nr:hypothetical protein [Mycolicibacterium fallax]